ncbi:hypothetical protein CYLTODRAFT_488951 [Cylindrobasidium torrendii FP15055 ss-10]|uniref:Uncharacterized protein n=1 Tax=Cylindrobasidium torrendii FP15055 ss-10 TaxID=1314674 RepID=A0A0D7BG22_9AGAR|nr:hypothetical protein CYLTODRAFT_488951 [Cylindrobasidium torrendii FP15055 ss-10]
MASLAVRRLLFARAGPLSTLRAFPPLGGLSHKPLYASVSAIRWASTDIKNTPDILGPLSKVEKEGFWRRNFYQNGKLSKGRIALACFAGWLVMGMAHLYSLHFNGRDPRIILASICARSLVYIDRTMYDRVDFTSFEQTLAYFRWCVLVVEWANSIAGTYHMFLLSGSRSHLTMEDLEPFMPKVDPTFAKLLAMPDGTPKKTFHTKVRMMCEDLHRWTLDFNSYAQEDIERWCNAPPNELTNEQRWAVAGTGIGLVTLIRVTWWGAPV